jgi:hypothetical protein
MKLKLTLIALLISATSAHAELVATDWKNTGDGLATLDTDTGIEWLDLTQTDGMSINQAEGLTVVGSTFDGWRLPTRAEVTQMMVNAFPSQAAQVQGSEFWTVTNSIADNEVDRFRAMFGHTSVWAEEDLTHGLFKNDDGQAYSVLWTGVQDIRSTNRVTMYSNARMSYTYNTTSQAYGVYLVSDGGTTLDSQLDPTINENNVNYVAPEPEPSPEASAGAGLNLASDLAPSGNVFQFVSK